MKAIRNRRLWFPVLVILVIFTTVFAPALAEEPPSTWRAKTGPGEAESLDSVVIEQHQVQVIEWTLREVDYYISVYEARIQSAREGIDRMKTIRENILREAEKVKLKGAGDKNT